MKKTKCEQCGIYFRPNGEDMCFHCEFITTTLQRTIDSLIGYAKRELNRDVFIDLTLTIKKSKL
jgi:hypothetical protein